MHSWFDVVYEFSLAIKRDVQGVVHQECKSLLNHVAKFTDINKECVPSLPCLLNHVESTTGGFRLHSGIGIVELNGFCIDFNRCLVHCKYCSALSKEPIE